jgi:hypothetical protein
VQLEDKLVDGRDAAHAESRERADVMEHGEETLPEPLVEAMNDALLEQRGQLLGAIRMILDNSQTLVVDQLHLPQRETRALDALQVAVSGKSHDLGTFVYATDRRDMLEQALAVLQPNLIHADDKTARELQAQFADVAERVSKLRHALTELEDSQDELLEGHQKEALEKAAPEPPGSGAKPTPKPSDPDAPRPPTTLTGSGGPELPEPARPPTTLVGPELREPARPPTTLVGPELPEPAPLPTTLVGPELPASPEPASTLSGPELAPEAPVASSLGDAEELAANAKLPWWRRPFG